MPDSGNDHGTVTTAVIAAPRETIWRALTDPDLLVRWRAPHDMTATMHTFDLATGYEMSLYYAEGSDMPGKSGGNEDRYLARFESVEPPHRLVEAIAFDADTPGMGDEMRMSVTLEEVDGGTRVTIAFDRLPPGVRPEDNDEGTRASLANLARLVEPGAV